MADLRSLLRQDVYPFVASRVINLLNAGEENAAEQWNRLAQRIQAALSEDAGAAAMEDDPDSDAQRCACGHVRGQHAESGCTARPHRVGTIPACTCTAFYDRAWSTQPSLAEGRVRELEAAVRGLLSAIDDIDQAAHMLTMAVGNGDPDWLDTAVEGVEKAHDLTHVGPSSPVSRARATLERGQ